MCSESLVTNHHRSFWQSCYRGSHRVRYSHPSWNRWKRCFLVSLLRWISYASSWRPPWPYYTLRAAHYNESNFDLWRWNCHLLRLAVRCIHNHQQEEYYRHYDYLWFDWHTWLLVSTILLRFGEIGESGWWEVELRIASNNRSFGHFNCLRSHH
jgi:hypothetical protein